MGQFVRSVPSSRVLHNTTTTTTTTTTHSMDQLQRNLLGCFLLAIVLVGAAVGDMIVPCPGDTRGDKRCNFDSTHRVCAKIGVEGTSFWKFTGQTSWCNTRGFYWAPFGRELRCPPQQPSWCICKWATASWIKGEGCTDAIEFNCLATDVCDLKQSYKDYGVNLKPAHDCIAKKCKKEWDACPERDPTKNNNQQPQCGVMG